MKLCEDNPMTGACTTREILNIAFVQQYTSDFIGKSCTSVKI